MDTPFTSSYKSNYNKNTKKQSPVHNYVILNITKLIASSVILLFQSVIFHSKSPLIFKQLQQKVSYTNY